MLDTIWVTYSHVVCFKEQSSTYVDLLTELEIVLYQHYGSTGCGVFKRGVQN